MKPREIDLAAIKRAKDWLGLISHPGVESGAIPKPSPLIDDKHFGGFTREQWMGPDMLPSLLSQSRAAQVLTLQLLMETGKWYEGLRFGLQKSIKALTFIIGDNYQLPVELR